MAGGFKAKIKEEHDGGGLVTAALGKAKEAFDPRADWKAMKDTFKDNPFDPKTEPLSSMIYKARGVTNLIGGISGKVGLACSISQRAHVLVPARRCGAPDHRPHPQRGRYRLPACANMVFSAILVALDLVKLRNPKLNPEEKAKLADQMIKDANDGAAGVAVALGMQFGGKLLGPLKNAKNGVLGPIQRWVGAAVKQVKSAIGGYREEVRQEGDVRARHGAQGVRR